MGVNVLHQASHMINEQTVLKETAVNHKGAEMANQFGLRRMPSKKKLHPLLDTPTRYNVHDHAILVSYRDLTLR